MAELVEKEFEVVLMEPNAQVDLRNRKVVAQIKPIKLFLLPNGTVDNKESMLWLMVDGLGQEFVAQISKKMLQEAMTKAGKTWDIQ